MNTPRLAYTAESGPDRDESPPAAPQQHNWGYSMGNVTLTMNTSGVSQPKPESNSDKTPFDYSRGAFFAEKHDRSKSSPASIATGIAGYVTVKALPERQTADCLPIRTKQMDHRAPQIETWIGKLNQPATPETEFTALTIDKEWSTKHFIFALVRPLLDVKDPDRIPELLSKLEEARLLTTLSQIEDLEKSTKAFDGEGHACKETHMVEIGGNFFFVRTSDPRRPVALCRSVHVGGFLWIHYLHEITEHQTWSGDNPRIYIPMKLETPLIALLRQH